MQFKNIGFRVPGLYAVVSIALREANMSATAQQRRDALAFWCKHGLQAAMDHAGVCRSTLHAWRAAEAGARRGRAGEQEPRAEAPARAQLAAGATGRDAPAAQGNPQHGARQVACAAG